jgi:hypothetical protein
MIIHLNFEIKKRSKEKFQYGTSLSSVHSRCNGAGDIIKSLCASITGCGAGVSGA